MEGQFSKPIWAVMTSLVLIVGTLTLSIPPQEAFAATDVDDCGDDSSFAGERMVMTANIASNFENCILISHPKVTLDCKGHIIDGVPLTGIGILVMADNVTIKNCTVTNFLNGILLRGSDGSTITKNNLTLNIFGIQIVDSDNNKISANTADLNHQIGLSCLFSTGNKFERNDADDNALDGLRFFDCDNNLVSANLFRSNDVFGIRLTDDSDNNTFKRNTADDSFVGISIISDSDSNKFTANTTNLNTEEGIDDNTTGGTGDFGTDNFYKGNSCSGNTTPSTPAGLCS